MTNRDAIELLEEVRMLDDTMYAYNPNYMEAIDMALNALEAEETWYATHEYPPKTRWIPCSERLPDEIGLYLVTVRAEFRPVRIYGFFPWDLDEMKKYWINDCNDHSHVFNHFVKAWMPLPEHFQNHTEEMSHDPI